MTLVHPKGHTLLLGDEWVKCEWDYGSREEITRGLRGGGITGRTGGWAGSGATLRRRRAAKKAGGGAARRVK